MSLQLVGRRNQDQDHHRKQRRLQKEKLVQEKNVVQLVKRKGSDEKRHRESHNSSLFIFNPLLASYPRAAPIPLRIVLFY
jgi:hypothetical protein